MKIQLLILVALASPLAVRTQDANPDSPTKQSLVELKKTFPFTPIAKSALEADISGFPPILMLPFTVRDQMVRPHLSESVKRKIDRNFESEYSVKDGGTLLKKDFGKTRLEIGTWGNDSGGIWLLKLSW